MKDDRVFNMVPVSELRIEDVNHGGYQRLEVHNQTINDMVRNFNWPAFGCLSVARRRNGDLYVVDGQQRLSVIKKLGNVSHVPCLIFDSEGRRTEASVFVDTNSKRTCVRSYFKFKANVMAKRNPECMIDAWLKENGLTVVGSGETLCGINFPTRLVRTWVKDEENCKKAIKIQGAILLNGESYTHYLHLGIWWLLQHGVAVEKYTSKLRLLGGKSVIIATIRKVQAETGAKNGNENLYGRAMLSLINRRCRKKIDLD